IISIFIRSNSYCRHLSVSPLHLFFFFLLTRPPPPSTLFPYTTLFRSSSISNPFRRLSQSRSSLRPVRPFRKRVGAPSTFARHPPDRKSTRLNSSHVSISYAVFCLKKKNIISSKKLSSGDSRVSNTRRY